MGSVCWVAAECLLPVPLLKGCLWFFAEGVTSNTSDSESSSSKCILPALPAPCTCVCVCV